MIFFPLVIWLHRLLLFFPQCVYNSAIVFALIYFRNLLEKLQILTLALKCIFLLSKGFEGLMR